MGNLGSKVLEKVVVNQLNIHINSSNTSNQYQSAYRKFHSTKKALLKIHSDILPSLDAGRVTALTLLDLSATFDTIDHTILISRLDDWFGITGKALNCFKSYLTGRCQRINIGECLSSEADLKFGVTQGSLLGPLLFTLYTTPLSSIIFEHAIPHHLNADDNQLYISFGNERQRSKYLSMFPIELLSVKTNPAKSARNLGVIIDKIFTLHSHISVVCKSWFYHMRDLRRIRRHLDLDSAKLLATALVSSRLEYCNPLFYGTADIDYARLRRVQNQLARLVTKSPPFTRCIPLLRSLY